ncbi:MAG: hypothetical protein ACK5II_07660 [Paracoccus sp. (in: a-proteobacteria)]
MTFSQTAQIISFQVAKNIHRRESSFWHIVNDQLRADLDQKRELLHSLGNRSAVLREVTADPDRGGDHIMILFSGEGPLQGYSFSFVVREIPDRQAIQAEVWVASPATDLLSKTISETPTWQYGRSWLNHCFSSAMNLIAPVSSSQHRKENSHGSR